VWDTGFQWGLKMRFLLAVLVAIFSSNGEANAFSVFYGPSFDASSNDFIFGTVTPASGFGFLGSQPGQIFLLGTQFINATGPINVGTFSGVLSNPNLSATTLIFVETPQVVIDPVTGTLTKVIYTQTVYPLSVQYAVFNPTPGSVSVLERGFIGESPFLTTLSFSQSGSTITGSLALPLTQNPFTFQGGPDFNATFTSPVSAVPLPPALPMFAFALIALGVSCFWNKRRARAVLLVIGVLAAGA